MHFYLQIKILGVINKNNEEVILACLGSEIPTAKVKKEHDRGQKEKREGETRRRKKQAEPDVLLSRRHVVSTK
ncbi:hypothetical protein A1OS_20055 [Enterovibrio norvegicus]|nr:hypothetical protein A1OS_20055 [Enterovibrio norvegicus]PMI32296.1 hypothetical protein BCU47_12965 [Enterovibrio norvegicus]